MTRSADEQRDGAGLTGAAAALRRSFDIYYRDRARTARMDALNAAFVRPGARVFEIGAHVGDRIGSFLRLGASVVAVEPQPMMARALRLLYGRQAGVELRPVAVGAQPGRTRLHLNGANPTVATTSAEFVAAAASAPGWQEQVWDRSISVEVTTLDALIASHGRPDFVKIDVEGQEEGVLSGLSDALPALSFEVTTMQRAVGLGCIDRLAELGRYDFNLSLGEEHRLRHEPWLNAEEMRDAIRALPEAANSGDVFARLR
jgi:FkbM family methyltransferase